MNNPTYEFKLLSSTAGHRAILPGRMLIQAQMESMSVPLAEGIAGGQKDVMPASVSLTNGRWYDASRLSEREDGYHDIKSLVFEPDAEYSVFYINHNVQRPYLFAVKVAPK